jgi:hypothetical protein
LDRAEGGVIVAVCLINKSGGGVSSDDVTAKREHVLQGYTALTSDSDDEPAEGTMVNRGTWNTASEVVNAPWENTVHTRFEEGYYPRSGQFKPVAAIPYTVLVNVLGIDSSKMLQDYSIAGVPGAIQRWICTTGDVITALGGEGFVWDDTHASRGRGIVVKIPNGRYIQGANWVFLPSPNLKHWNIRRGVNINGEIGTMEDYGAGRVAFRNATFDGVLISGVANIGLGNNLNSYSVPSTEIRDGIIRFNNGDTSRGGGIHEYYADRKQTESITLAHSVNLSPFRTIRLGLKFPYGGQWGTKDGNGHLVGILWALPTSITPNYNISRNSKIHPNIIKRVGYNRNIIPRYWGGAYPSISAGTEYFVDIDVSDLQGHHRIVLGIGAESPVRNEATIQTDVFVTNSVLGISHIEFIN